MNIRHPEKKEIKELKQIWKICFGDSDAYIDFYFKNCFQPSQTLVCEEEDHTLAGMLTVLPALMYTKTSIFKGGYVYGVATLPEHRSKGIMTQLEQAAEEQVKSAGGSFLTLVPATNELFGMYEKLGYQCRYYLHDLDVTKDEVKPYATLSNLDSVNENYFIILRQLYLNSFPESIQFDGHLQHYFYAELKKSGCEQMAVQNRFGHGHLVYYVKEGELFVREVGMNPNCLEGALFSVMEKLKVEKAHITTAFPLFTKGEVRPYGMIKYLDEKSQKQKHKVRYMNLMLD